MNMKKIVVSALAALTAAISISAVTVNANPLGESNLDFNFEVINGVATPAPSVELDGKVGMTLTVNASIPDNALANGKYTFHAELLADEDLENLFKTTTVLAENQEIDYFDLLEINFKDEAGTPVQPENVTLSFSTSKASGYNAVYMYDHGKFIKIGDMNEATPLHFHFSKFVIASIRTIEDTSKDSEISVEPTSSQPSVQPSIVQPSTDVKTGDSATTAIVFAVMAVVALGTTAVALKSKKSSK